jgi:hypothetical protein
MCKLTQALESRTAAGLWLHRYELPRQCKLPACAVFRAVVECVLVREEASWILAVLSIGHVGEATAAAVSGPSRGLMWLGLDL